MKKILLAALAFFMITFANAQWVPQNAGFINDTLAFYEMSIPSKNVAWAVCFDAKGRGLNTGRFILDFTRTTDGGATWIPGKMGNDHTLQFSNISAIDGQEAWVAMNKRFATGGGLYHTTDGGVTWEKSNPDEIFNENSYPNFVHFKDKNHGVAMGDPNDGYWEVYTTNNGGKKWKRVPAANLPAPLVNEFGLISGFAAVDKTVWFGTSGGRIYKSTNFGKDWTAYVVDPAGKFVNEIAFNDDMLHGVTHLRDNFGNTFLYSTTDGGVTWTPLGQPANWKNSRITAVPGTNALISTGISGLARFRGSAISYDNGTTWTELENAVNKTVSRFYDAETGYACAAFVTGPPLRGGIFKSAIVFETPVDSKTTIAGKNVGSKQPGIEAKTAELIKVYPTPANDVITILLQDPLANTNKDISIVSMDGRVMQTTKQAGSNLIRLNVSKLPAGIYTVRITTNAQTINKVFTISR